jgi:hypothetical protein
MALASQHTERQKCFLHETGMFLTLSSVLDLMQRWPGPRTSYIFGKEMDMSTSCILSEINIGASGMSERLT